MPNSPYDLSDRVCDFAEPTLTFQETNRLLERAERAEREVNQLKTKLKEANELISDYGDAMDHNNALRINATEAVKRLTAEAPTPNQRKAIKAMLDDPEQFCADALWWCDLLSDDQSRLSAESAKENNNAL